MPNTDNNNGGLYSTLWRLARRILKLRVELVRLTIAERLTRLFVSILSTALLIILGAFVLAFISTAAVDLLTEALPSWVASLIIAGVYVLVILVVYLLRRPLIINPIARFVSRLILEAPSIPQTPQASDENEDTQE